MFIKLLFTDPYLFLFWVVVVMFSICVHEYAHARMALWCGDDTAAREGHLTLNPMIQMGRTSILLLLLLGIAWGSVPVNSGYLRRKRWGEFLVAAVGPAANLLLALVFTFVAAFLAARVQVSPLYSGLLRVAGEINVLLFLLNIIPVPPLDGWNILMGVAPVFRRFEGKIAPYSVVLLIIFFVSPLSSFIWISGKIMASIWFNIVFTVVAGV